MLDILDFLQHDAYKDVSLITKSNLKMHLIGCWRSQIILIATSICKGFEVKFLVFLVFSYHNYSLWLVTYIFVKPIYLKLYCLYHYSIFVEKNVILIFFLYLQKKNIKFYTKIRSLSLVGGSRWWPKWPRPRAGPEQEDVRHSFLPGLKSRLH